MTLIIGLAIGLIIGGLLICFLATHAKLAILVTVLQWVGIILVVVGLVFLLTPVLVWLNAQLHSMLGL